MPSQISKVIGHERLKKEKDLEWNIVKHSRATMGVHAF